MQVHRTEQIMRDGNENKRPKRQGLSRCNKIINHDCVCTCFCSCNRSSLSFFGRAYPIHATASDFVCKQSNVIVAERRTDYRFRGWSKFCAGRLRIYLVSELCLMMFFYCCDIAIQKCIVIAPAWLMGPGVLFIYHIAQVER